MNTEKIASKIKKTEDLEVVFWKRKESRLYNTSRETAGQMYFQESLNEEKRFNNLPRYDLYKEPFEADNISSPGNIAIAKRIDYIILLFMMVLFVILAMSRN